MVAQPRPTPSRLPALRAIGRSGLAQYSGYIHEQRIKEYMGRRFLDAIREMLDADPDVGAMIFAITQLLRRVEWQVLPGGQTTQDDEAARFVESNFNDMEQTWAEILTEILTMLWFGWCYLEVVWKHRDGPAGADPTTRSKFTDGKVGWRGWYMRGQESLLNWDIDDEDNVRGWTQTPPPDFLPRYLPMERGLHFRTISHKGNPEGRSILQNAISPWYYKKNIQAIEATGVERDLVGLPIAHVPAELLSDSASTEEKALLGKIKDLVVNTHRNEQEGIIFPLIYDEAGKELYRFELLNSGGTRQFDTDKIITRYSRMICQTLLADFIKLGQEAVGSFALSSDKTSLFAVALGAWLDSIAAVINERAIPVLLRLNGYHLEVMPRLHFGDIEARDVAQTVDAIAKLAAAGMEIFPNAQITKHLLDTLDLPSPTIEELEAQVEEQKAQAAAMQQATLEGQQAALEGQRAEIEAAKSAPAKPPPGEGPPKEGPPKRAGEDEPDQTWQDALVADLTERGLTVSEWMRERGIDPDAPPARQASDPGHALVTRIAASVIEALEESGALWFADETDGTWPPGFFGPDDTGRGTAETDTPAAGGDRADDPAGGTWPPGFFGDDDPGAGTGVFGEPEENAALSASSIALHDLGQPPAKAAQSAPAFKGRPVGADGREEWIANEFGEWADALDVDQRSALGDYAYKDYQPINDALRAGASTLSTKQRMQTIRIQRSLGRHRMEEDVVTYRGMGGQPVAQLIERGQIAVGTRFGDAGFVSTSLDKSVAQGFAQKHHADGVLVEVRVRRGARAGYLDTFQQMLDQPEHEVLLHNASKFTVKSVKRAKEGHWHVVVEHDERPDKPDLWVGAPPPTPAPTTTAESPPDHEDKFLWYAFSPPPAAASEEPEEEAA